MSINVLANRRNALLFAGGVVACATLATSNMGSQYNPDGEEGAAQEYASAPSDNRSSATLAQRETGSASYGSESDSVFGDYGDEPAEFDSETGDDPDLLYGSDDSSAQPVENRSKKPVRRPATMDIRPVRPGDTSSNPLQSVADEDMIRRRPAKSN